MSALGRYTRLLGTSVGMFVLGLGGPMLKRNSTALEARNNADSAFAVLRGSGTTTGANDLRPWSSFAKTYYIDPATGNNANPGTQASPFQTLHGGLWPALLTLLYCDVSVVYSSTTTDTLVAETLAVPEGVRVSFSSPLTNLLGTRTVAAGSTTTSVNDSVGGITVDTAEGTRLRWVTSAVGMTGQVYSVTANTAGAFAIGNSGMAAVPNAGDTFVIERAAGGWVEAGSGTTIFDMSVAPHAGMFFDDFKLLATASGGIRFTGGDMSLSGFFFDCSGTFGSLTFRGQRTLRLGRTYGMAGQTNSGTQGARGTCCYIKGDGTGGGMSIIGVANVWNVDTVVANCGVTENQNAYSLWNNQVISGHGGALTPYTAFGSGINILVASAKNLAAGATRVWLFSEHCTAFLNQASIDNTVAVTPIDLQFSSYLDCTSCTGTGTGVNGAAVTTDGFLRDTGGNTMRGSGGAGAAVLVTPGSAVAWSTANFYASNLVLVVGDGTNQVNYLGGAWVADREYSGSGTTNGLVTDYIVEVTALAANVTYQATAMGSTSTKRAVVILVDASESATQGAPNPHTITFKPPAGKKLNGVVDGTLVILNGGGVISVREDENGNWRQLGFTP